MAETKYFLNSTDSLVRESIDGTLALNPNLVRLDGYPAIKVILDRTRYEDIQKSETSTPVAVVCGGGSGHEPAFLAYAGQGMLSAAVCGDLFASPSESAVLAALRNSITASGALVVVLNYTGDRLNFGAAVEGIKMETGFDCRMVIVADDVALRQRQTSKAGARGLSGAMLVLKCAGAVAAAGKPLDDVEAMAQLVNRNVTTMGCSLTECNLPGRKVSEHRLGANEMEMGLGAHGEPGVYRQNIEDLNSIVKTLVKRVACVGEFEDEIQKVHPGDDVVVLINNMGGVTQLEMGSIVHSVMSVMKEELSVNILRIYSGIFLSSLDMKGFSISLLRLPEGDGKEALLEALDAPTEAPGWRFKPIVHPMTSVVPMKPKPEQDKEKSLTDLDTSETMKLVEEMIHAACTAIISSADSLNELDRQIGDGDTGDTFRTGAERILSNTKVTGAKSLRMAIFEIADIAGKDMGGSSGALLKIFFFAFATAIHGHGWTMTDVCQGIQMGVEKMTFYGGAKKGDSTMMDALIPLSEAFAEAVKQGSSPRQASKRMLQAAREGCDTTRELIAKAGRASYVPEEAQVGVTDPGAEACVIIMNAMDGILSRTVETER